MANLINRLHQMGWVAVPGIDFGDHIVRMWRKRDRICSIALYPGLTHSIFFDRVKD